MNEERKKTMRYRVSLPIALMKQAWMNIGWIFAALSSFFLAVLAFPFLPAWFWLTILFGSLAVMGLILWKSGILIEMKNIEYGTQHVELWFHQAHYNAFTQAASYAVSTGHEVPQFVFDSLDSDRKWLSEKWGVTIQDPFEPIRVDGENSK